MTQEYSAAELSVVGKAKCGCVYHTEDGIPCQHDLAVLASIRKRFKSSYSFLPMDREQMEFLEAATNRVTYDEAMKQIKHNIAFGQQLPHLAERTRKIMGELRTVGEITT